MLCIYFLFLMRCISSMLCYYFVEMDRNINSKRLTNFLYSLCFLFPAFFLISNAGIDFFFLKSDKSNISVLVGGVLTGEAIVASSIIPAVNSLSSIFKDIPLTNYLKKSIFTTICIFF